MTTAYSFVYAVTAKSSIKVLAELLKVSEAGVDRVAETRDGFVASISIPGDPNSGAIYAYDRPTSSMSIFTVDGRDSDFTAKEIAQMFPVIVNHLNTPSPAKQATASKQREFKQATGNKQREHKPAHQHHQKQRHNNRSNNHPQRQRQNVGAPVRPQPALVAA